MRALLTHTLKINVTKTARTHTRALLFNFLVFVPFQVSYHQENLLHYLIPNANIFDGPQGNISFA